MYKKELMDRLSKLRKRHIECLYKEITWKDYVILLFAFSPLWVLLIVLFYMGG